MKEILIKLDSILNILIEYAERYKEELNAAQQYINDKNIEEKDLNKEESELVNRLDDKYEKLLKILE